MNGRDAIKLTLDMGDMVGLAYVQDLTDAELMLRPHADCNHINWQLGHIISSENHMLNQLAPGSMPPLPAGFAEKYTKETAKSNDGTKFASKETLLATHKQQRAATLAALAKLSDADLDKSTGIEYAPTVGALVALQGSHWLMHAGQWVIVRRGLGKPALF